MSVRPEDTARHLAARGQAKRRRALERTGRLLGRVPAAKELLGRFGARRAWVFGSLLTGSATEESDVDLAVEGLPESAYFPALGALMQLFTGPVDLVRMEEAGESLRQRVLAEGREL
jgi:predicted nucleotidyltransferase